MYNFFSFFFCVSVIIVVVLIKIKIPKEEKNLKISKKLIKRHVFINTLKSENPKTQEIKK